jgi:hypothetical protein
LTIGRIKCKGQIRFNTARHPGQPDVASGFRSFDFGIRPRLPENACQQ